VLGRCDAQPVCWGSGVQRPLSPGLHADNAHRGTVARLIQGLWPCLRPALGFYDGFAGRKTLGCALCWGIPCGESLYSCTFAYAGASPGRLPGHLLCLPAGRVGCELAARIGLSAGCRRQGRMPVGEQGLGKANEVRRLVWPSPMHELNSLCRGQTSARGPRDAASPEKRGRPIRKWRIVIPFLFDPGRPWVQCTGCCNQMLFCSSGCRCTPGNRLGSYLVCEHKLDKACDGSACVHAALAHQAPRAWR
jgi:hypothetical protein